MTSFKISIQKPDSLDKLTPLRKQYLDGLQYPQEYYVELEVQAANPFLITINDNPAGYFIISHKNALLEYYITPEWLNQNDSIFGDIIKQFEVKTAWCKTYDSDLLSCCFSFQKSARVLGVLFREFQAQPLPPISDDISIRLADPLDETLIIAVNEEVFDHPGEVLAYIKARQIFLFEKGRDLVGFGIFSRCIPDRNDFDIGMLVVEKHRRQGYATQILQYLINHCLKNGWRPGAGCHVDNMASRKSLEKVGFVARHRLIEFTF